MRVTVYTKNLGVVVEAEDEEESWLPEEIVGQKVAEALRKIAEGLCPSPTPELIINEDEKEKITEEVQYDFLNKHEGSIH